MVKKWVSDLRKLLGNKNMLVAFLLLLVLGFTFGYYATDILNKKNNISELDTKMAEENNQSIDDLNNIPVDTKAAETKVNTKTKIVFETEYLKSKDIEKKTTVPEKDILGFNRKDIERFYKDWTIINFTEEELTLYRSIDSYSPKNFKVGVVEQDGYEYIAVFVFDEEGQEVVDYISDKSTVILSEKDQNRLRQGMVFDNIDDVHRMLENYDL